MHEEIKKNMPIPRKQFLNPRKSKYVILFNKMDIGDCVDLPSRLYTQVPAWAKRAGIKVTQRRIDPETVRIWRIDN